MAVSSLRNDPRRQPRGIGIFDKLPTLSAKVVKHSRYVIFQMAEVAVPRELFRAILERIGRLWLPPPRVQKA